MEEKVKISWYGIHQGEEPPLVPAGGIFFSGCNLHCVFCQNYQISQKNSGKFYSVEELSDIMLKLQHDGAVNIDLVTPTIWHKQIKTAITMAKKAGLKLPLVWNSNAYEDIKTLQSMEGLINIYLPDFKYSDDDLALKYSGIKNYSATAKIAIKEMLRQVGNLKIKNGVAKQGVIIRHLVLPNNLKNSFGVLEQLASMDKNIYVSLMNQYFPTYQADKFPKLNQKVSQKEFDRVCEYYFKLGLHKGWVQEGESQDNLVPDFTKEEPFV